MAAERSNSAKYSKRSSGTNTDGTLAGTLSTSYSGGNTLSTTLRSGSLYGDVGGIPFGERNPSSTSLNTKAQQAATSLPPISIFSGNTSSSSSSGGGGSSTGQPATPRSTHYELLRELVHKRIATFIYFKRLYEGRSFYLNTITITPELLLASNQHANDDITPSKRAYMFYILGISMGPLLDLTNSTYYAKALHTLAQEYDTFATEVAKSKRGRMNLRKIRMPGDNSNHNSNNNNTHLTPNGSNSIYTNSQNNPSNATIGGHSNNNTNNSRFDLTDLDTTEYTRLELHSVPFELDYSQTLYSLCDIMAEVYGKLLDASCDQAFWDLVLKLDARLKKVIIHLSKIFDSVARHAVKEEFAAIDPLLANVGSIISIDEPTGSNDASSIYSL
ncbi:hypothetical protein BDF19DRAFT_433447 [Syncephalis fuscata]|nr:hypothetical protein BDF19DRAFT_433447 [Syncephalis fuscata]